MANGRKMHGGRKRRVKLVLRKSHRGRGRRRASSELADDMLLPVPYIQNQIQERPKIPRPPNAFMLFANEWRKKLALQFPSETNKDISVRLGGMWKGLDDDSKKQYFALARRVDSEHKRKYPDYVYNPKDARLRKAMRLQEREHRGTLGRGHAIALRQAQAQVQAQEVELSLEERRKSIRKEVEHGMMTNFSEAVMEFDPTPSLNPMQLPATSEYSILSDVESDTWFSLVQASQSNAPFTMTHSDNSQSTNSKNDTVTVVVTSSGSCSNSNLPVVQTTAGESVTKLNQTTQQYQIFTPVTIGDNQHNVTPTNQKPTEQVRLLSIPSSKQCTADTQKRVLRNINNTVATEGFIQKQNENGKRQNGSVFLSSNGKDMNMNGCNTIENQFLPSFDQAFSYPEMGRFVPEGNLNYPLIDSQNHVPQYTVNNSTNSVWNFAQVIPITSVGTLSSGSVVSAPQMPPVFESSFPPNYTYFSYMNEFNHIYSTSNNGAWSETIRYDMPLNTF